MKAKVALVALLGAAHASMAHAAAIPVVIDKLNDMAKTCGIAEAQLESVALRTLEKGELQPDPDAGGWLHVRVNVTRTWRSACAAHISVQMKASTKPLPPGGIANPKQRSHVPEVVLCNEGGDYSASKASFSLEMESAVDQYIMRCLGSLRY